MSVPAVARAPAVAELAEPAELTRALYERHGQRVFTFCYSRLRDREAAQDAAQTTFIYVLRALQRGVVPQYELAWLLKIAFNVCRGARRSAGRETAARDDLDDIDTLEGPAAATFDETVQVAALRAGLATLPDNQRRAILLREWQGLSYAEIADELDTTVGAVETLLFRARRNLAARLQDIRGGVGALDFVSLAGILRSVFRGGLAKLGFVGAATTVALAPVVAMRDSAAVAKAQPTKTPIAKHVRTSTRQETLRAVASSAPASVARRRPADRPVIAAVTVRRPEHGRPASVEHAAAAPTAPAPAAPAPSPSPSPEPPAAQPAPPPPATDPAPPPVEAPSVVDQQPVQQVTQLVPPLQETVDTLTKTVDVPAVVPKLSVP